MEQFGFDEQNGLPVIGSRVRRGKNWNYGNEDGNQPGTVIGHAKQGNIQNFGTTLRDSYGNCRHS